MTPAATPARPRRATRRAEPPGEAEPLRLVTLGDGYTAGTDTATARRDSWPAQLAAAMDARRPAPAPRGQPGRERSHQRGRRARPAAPGGGARRRTWSRSRSGSTTSSPGTSASRTTASTWPASLTRCSTMLPPDRIFLITTPDHTLTRARRRLRLRARPAARTSPEANAILADAGSRAGHPGHRHLRRQRTGRRRPEPGGRARGPTPAPSSTPAGWRSSARGCAGCSWERSRSTLGVTCPAGPVRPVTRSREASKEDRLSMPPLPLPPEAVVDPRIGSSGPCLLALEDGTRLSRAWPSARRCQWAATSSSTPRRRATRRSAPTPATPARSWS